MTLPSTPADARSFLLLVRHFWLKLAGLHNLSGFDFNWTGALAFAALPGAFNAILLLNKYSSLLQWLRGNSHFNPYRVCLPDEYFFLTYSMTITGLVTLLAWDRLLPDRIDFNNFAPLPLSARRIFLANTAALGTLAALFAIDINVVACLLFPLFVTMQFNFAAFLEFGFAHALSVLGVSLFTFLALIATQGLLMSCLPASIYRRVSLLVRISLLTVLIALFGWTLLSPDGFVHLSRAWTQALPPVWFLSLFESRIGELHSHAPFGATVAFDALALTTILAAISFFLSYQRHFLRIPELQEGTGRRVLSNKRVSFLSDRLFALLFRPGLESAFAQFTFKTILRSESPLFCAGSALGFGLLVTASGLRAAVTHSAMIAYLLSAPLTVLSFLLIGVRASFELPGAVNANWPFRLLAAEGLQTARKACRKLLFFIGILVLAVLWLPLALKVSSVDATLTYLAMHVALARSAAEILTFKLKAIPFTCAFVPTRDGLLKAMLAAILFLLLGLPLLAALEAATARHRWTLALFIACAIAPVFWLRRGKPLESDAPIYESKAQDALVLLRLTGD